MTTELKNMTLAELETAQAAFEAEKAANERQRDEEKEAALGAFRAWKEDGRQLVRTILGDAEQTLTVDVERGWDESLPTIRVNNDDDNCEERSLRWSVTIAQNYHHDNQVEVETNSWSGMEVTTPEQVAYFKKVGDMLDCLVRADWTSVLETLKEQTPDEYAIMVTKPLDDPGYQIEIDRIKRVAKAVDEICSKLTERGAKSVRIETWDGETITPISAVQFMEELKAPDSEWLHQVRTIRHGRAVVYDAAK